MALGKGYLLKRLENKGHGVQIPSRLYRIGDLIRNTPFSRQTIHNYTIMGLIREAQWTDGGHRLYDESVFRRLSRIIELKKTKTLCEIRQILREEEAAGGDGDTDSYRDSKRNQDYPTK